MEWLLWFRDTVRPIRPSSDFYPQLSIELHAIGLMPVGRPAGIFPRERNPGHWIVRVRTPGEYLNGDIARAADQAGRKAGFRMERPPQLAPPDARY